MKKTLLFYQKNSLYLIFFGLLILIHMPGLQCAVRAFHIKPTKNVSAFYASKSFKADLIQEPVEWPVRIVYSRSIFGKILRKVADFFGGHVTRRIGKKFTTANPRLVQKYIDHYLTLYQGHINMDEFIIPRTGFRTFNDWFIRTLKNPELNRPLENNTHAIASPADCKLLIIPNIALNTLITIKEEQFDLATFLQDQKLAKLYEHGVMMIFRLSPYNYHHYHYPFNCTISIEKCIDGKYHSVNPRAFVCDVKPLTVNKRSYEILIPKHIQHANKKIVMMQVGATTVASIVNHFMDYTESQPTLKYAHNKIFTKGEETGYFQFGGSTVVLLFPPNTITPNQQIIKNSLNGYETAVDVRETIAHWH